MPARREKSWAEKATAPGKENAAEIPLTITSENVTNRRRLPIMPDVTEDSVIMLSSAETTLINDPSSLMMLTAVDFHRPSTRMSHIDMTLEETVRMASRRTTSAFDAEETNMSLINIVQTPGVERARPKSSIVLWRTRSKSMLPPMVEQENQVHLTRGRSRNIDSEEFSIITKRARTATSRPPTAGRISEEVLSNEQSSTSRQSERSKKKKSNLNGDNAHSNVPERQSRTLVRKTDELATSRCRTKSASRKRPESGGIQDRIQTRSASRGRQPMLKEAINKKDKASQQHQSKKGRNANVATPENKISNEARRRSNPHPEYVQNQSVANKTTQSHPNVSNRREVRRNAAQQLNNSEIETEQLSQTTSDSNHDQSSASMHVSKRRKGKFVSQQAESASDNKSLSSKRSENNSSKPAESIPILKVSERKRKIAVPSQENSSQNSTTSQSEDDHSKFFENSPFSNVSKRKLPKLASNKSHDGPSVAPEEPTHTETVAYIGQIVSTSVAQQPKRIVLLESVSQNKSDRSRSRKQSTRNASDSKENTKTTIRTRSASRGRQAASNKLETTQEATMVSKRVRKKKMNCPCCAPNKTASTIEQASRFPSEATECVAQPKPTDSRRSPGAKKARNRGNSAIRTFDSDSKLESPNASGVSSTQPDSSNKHKPRSRADAQPKQSAPDTAGINAEHESLTVPTGLSADPNAQQDLSLKRNGGRSRVSKPSRTGSKSVLRNASSASNTQRSRSRSVPKQTAPDSADINAKQESLTLPTVLSADPIDLQDSSLKRNGGRSRSRVPKPSRTRSKSVLRNASSASNTQSSRSRSVPKQSAPHSAEINAKHESPTVSTDLSADPTAQQDSSLKRNGGRSRVPKPSRTRSKSVLRNASSASNTQPSRSRSVPRDALLSPVRVADQQPTTGDGSHVPVYRKYAEEVLTRSESVKNLILIPPEPTAADGDIYAFDSPSQPTGGSSSGEIMGVKKKGSTAKNRPRLAKRITPAKKAHLNMFGTDMDRIRNIVKRIGGGPIRQPAPSGAGTKSAVDTATLTAFMQPQKPQSNAHNDPPRSISPPALNNDTGDDHHNFDDNEFDTENIPTIEMPVPVAVSPPRINRQIQRVQQQKITGPAVTTPDKTQPNSTLNFSPLGASSPWRVQSENFLPKTFYFSRSKDMLPSYESDVVVRHDDDHQKSSSKQLETMAAPGAPRMSTSPSHQPPVPSAAMSEAMFREIQKSYEQLRVTSEMSNKLISAMRQYKSNIHNQTASFSEGPVSEDEQLIAKFREYEANMKKTYLKLRQWYERSQRTLTHSIRTIEQVSAVPKTKAQTEVLENFRRNSERFVAMITELESAMNDSNIENISPPRAADIRERPAFKEIIISDRNANNKNRSPLKTLDIMNVVPQFSPVKSPLVKASLSAFSNIGKKQSLTKSRDRFSRLSLAKIPEMPLSQTAPIQDPIVIEIADTFSAPHPPSHCVTSEESSLTDRTVTGNQPNKDLFGFEDDAEDDFTGPTPSKITKETLKERLQSVRKLLPQRREQNQSKSAAASTMPKIFGSPRKLRPVNSAFSSSTPLMDKRTRPRRGNPQSDLNVSAIAEGQDELRQEQVQQENRKSLPVSLFDELTQEVASTSMRNANRTYTRIPLRNHKRKRNIYLADLGLSDDEDESDTSTSESEDAKQAAEAAKIKQQTKKRRLVQTKKKHQVDQTNEFKQFVNEFNSMCDEVNRYQLVIEKPVVMQRV